MKRVCCHNVLLVICTVFVVLSVGCGQKLNKNHSDGASMKEYYSKEDFQSIEIGKSTYKDVYNIAPPQFIQVTSYGGFCEYPMRSGDCLRIKFYGKEMIVGMVEVDSYLSDDINF